MRFQQHQRKNKTHVEHDYFFFSCIFTNNKCLFHAAGGKRTECVWSLGPLHIFTTVRLFHVALARVSASLWARLMMQELWLPRFYCAAQQLLSGHSATALSLQPAPRLIACAVGDKLTYTDQPGHWKMRLSSSNKDIRTFTYATILHGKAEGLSAKQKNSCKNRKSFLLFLVLD